MRSYFTWGLFWYREAKHTDQIYCQKADDYVLLLQMPRHGVSWEARRQTACLPATRSRRLIELKTKRLLWSNGQETGQATGQMTGPVEDCMQFTTLVFVWQLMTLSMDSKMISFIQYHRKGTPQGLHYYVTTIFVHAF